MGEYLKQISSGSIDTGNKGKGERIEIIVAGDLCPDRRVEEMALNKKIDDLYNDALEELKHKDLSIVNLECPLTHHNNPISKQGPNLIANPKSIAVFTQAGFDIVTLANNHMLDQGESGLLDTINHCQDAGLKTVGAGANIKDASKILNVKAKATKIAVLNFAEMEFSIATSKTAGVFPLNPVANFYQLKEATAQADVVIVIVHGGNILVPLPGPDFVNVLRYFADLGATAVIAHHTHCASGLEIYNGVPIFYSLGNFLFDRKHHNPNWFKSYFVRLSIENSTISTIDLIPYYQFKNGKGIRLMRDTDKHEFLKEIALLSTTIINSEKLRGEWEMLISNQENRYLSIACSLNKIEKKMLRYGLTKNFLLKRDQLLKLLNVIKCQSHREIMIATLEREIVS